MNNIVDERLIISEFFQTMHQSGIFPRNEFTPITDGKLHRFAVEGDRYGSTSGAYFLHINEWPNWGFQDWHRGTVWYKFKLSKEATGYHKPTREEYLRKQAESERRKQEDMKRQKESEQAAILTAYSLWRSDSINHNVEDINQNPYMQFKQISLPPHCYAGINSENSLLFPLYDSLSGKFRTIQFVSPPDSDGHSSKRFYAGISTKGVWYPIRQFKGDTVFITEGIVTALSVDEFTHRECSVAAAMNCGNLLEVCKNYRTRLNEARLHNPNLQNQKIVIAADNDRNDAGKIAAEKVIEAGFADSYTMPKKQGMDWNDYINFLKRTEK